MTSLTSGCSLQTSYTVASRSMVPCAMWFLLNKPVATLSVGRCCLTVASAYPPSVTSSAILKRLSARTAWRPPALNLNAWPARMGCSRIS